MSDKAPWLEEAMRRQAKAVELSRLDLADLLSEAEQLVEAEAMRRRVDPNFLLNAFYERRGDRLLAAGRRDDAAEAYRAAVDKLRQNSGTGPSRIAVVGSRSARDEKADLYQQKLSARLAAGTVEPPTDNPKRDLLLVLLESSWAYLQVDGTAPGVDLPDWLRSPSVTLQIGYDMPIPIDDLKIDERGVSATLSFRQVPHLCRLPWRSLFAVSDVTGHGVVFPEDVPADEQAQGSPESPGARSGERAGAQISERSIDRNGDRGAERMVDRSIDRRLERSPSPQRALSPVPAPALASESPPGGSDGDAPAPSSKTKKPRPSHLKLVE